ncbi:MAG: hypothetical protein AAGD06_31725, partial [Acidobacteriota bacterium]
MRRHSAFVRMSVVTALIALCAFPAFGSDAALFTITDREPGFHPATADFHRLAEEVAIDLDPQALDRNPESFSFELPNGKRLLVDRDRFVAEADHLAWIGVLTAEKDGLSGYVHLVDHGDQVSGILNLGLERYQIVATEDAGHRLLRLEGSSVGCLHHPEDGHDLGARHHGGHHHG